MYLGDPTDGGEICEVRRDNDSGEDTITILGGTGVLGRDSGGRIDMMTEILGDGVETGGIVGIVETIRMMGVGRGGEARIGLIVLNQGPKVRSVKKALRLKVLGFEPKVLRV
jgi:hypothetical protein